MPSAPYDTVTDIINAAKVRLNDEITTLSPVGGKILSNTQPFTQQIVNSAWRKLQSFLADLKYTGLEAEVVFTNVAAAGTTDPAAQAYIDFSAYWDGAVSHVAPVLPQALIRPYELWERATGSAALMTEMDQVLNGLPASPKINWNRQWEWRNDKLYFPGSLLATDIRLRYAASLADFEDTSTPWYAQTVPMMRCLDAFADYCCREVSIARDEADAAVAFQLSAENNARLMVNRDTVGQKSIIKSSEYRKMKDRYTPGNQPPTVV